MIRIRMIIFALIAALVVHPVGLAGIGVEQMAEDAHQAEHADLSLLLPTDHNGKQELGHINSGDRHDHRGGVCCSTSGMCIAILVERPNALEFDGKGAQCAGPVRTLTARTVDTPLHPPKIVS